MTQNLKIRIVTLVVLLVHTLEILQQIKTTPLLAELKQSGTKIPAKEVDVLRLIDTKGFYELINESINKYNDRNTVQGFTNDMVGNADAPTVVEGINKATMVRKLGKNETYRCTLKQPW